MVMAETPLRGGVGRGCFPAPDDGRHRDEDSDMKDPRNQFEALRMALRTHLYERDEEIDATLAALLAREHVLLLGPPGTAKSLLARLLAQAIEGSYFDWLFSKFTVPEEVLGPISVSQLKRDRYQRVTAGKLPTAEIAVLDEVFKANSAILNALLTILNERVYHDGTRGPVDCPLELAVTASNELPQDDGLEALYDRILVRLEVSPIRDDDAFESLLQRNGTASPVPRLERPALEAIRQEVATVTFGPDIAATVSSLRRRLQTEGIRPSDRRWVQVVGYLRAVAWMDGDTEVNDDHLVGLMNVLWDEPGQRPAIETAILSIANPTRLKVMTLLDAAKAEWSAADQGNRTEVEAAGLKVRMAFDQMERLDRNNAAVRAGLGELMTIRKAVQAAVLAFM